MIHNFSKLEEIPIKNILPQGEMLSFLKRQVEGLTGNIEAAGYPFDTYGWGNFNDDKDAISRGDSSWWPYEQTGYWLDGAEKCAVLLNDAKLKEKVQKIIKYVIDNKDDSGYLGPEFLKQDNMLRWAHVVFFRALMTEYSATGNEKIVDLIKKHYCADNHKYSNGRDVLNIEIILWLYLHTGEMKFLKMAEEAFEEYNEIKNDDLNADMQMSRKIIKVHGVSFNEYSKLGAMLYICTGNDEYLKPVINAYKKVDRYQMLVDGLHSSEEMLWNNNYMRAHETCNVTDYTWTLGYLLMATGNAEWADKIERCIFNAGIGSIDENFKALQYFSSPNQLIANRTSNRCRYYKGDGRMSYAPNPGTECCVGNVNRFFPNYCSRMWMKKDNDIFAVFYGASMLKINSLEITEVTDYPFRDTVEFNFKTKEDTYIRFNMRIPKWCRNASVFVNGKKAEINNKNGFALLARTFKNGDTITLKLPSEIKVCNYHGQGVYVEKGPLVYAFGMYGRRENVTRGDNYDDSFPTFNIYPDKEWNYALCVSDEEIKKIKYIENPIKGNPWDIRTVPNKIIVPAKKVTGWTLEHHKRIKRYKESPLVNRNTEIMTGDFTFTPKIPSKSFIRVNGLGRTEMIELVPLACAKLRLTIFPDAAWLQC